MRRFIELEKVVAPTVAGLSYEFVGLEYLTTGKRAVLRVYIDKVSGVDADDCAKVSRMLSSVLDVEANLVNSYDLEVSSPGLDRKLFSLEQFEKQLGKELKFKTMDSIAVGNGCFRRNFKGKLQKVDKDKLDFEVDGQILSVNFDEIEQANVVAQW